MLPDRGALAFLAPSNSLLSRRRLIVTETLSFRRNQVPRPRPDIYRFVAISNLSSVSRYCVFSNRTNSATLLFVDIGRAMMDKR